MQTRNDEVANRVGDGDHKYRMVISRNTIDKLGIKLYDKVSAVLAELIANAYDADATQVTIRAPLGTYLASKSAASEGSTNPVEIVVQDDGIGMTATEVNAFYLKVGTDRRVDPERGGVSPERHRKVMGRKGIGKLAPFGICHEIEVVTAGGRPTKNGYKVSDLILRLDDILQESEQPYYPIPGPLDETWRSNRGTTITLRSFDYRKVPDAETLNRQIAARFGLPRTDWKMTILDALTEGKFEVGELDIDTLEGTAISVDDSPVRVDGQELPVRGWIGYARKSYRDEVMAGVRIYARGKIVAQTRDFDISTGFTGEYKLRSYLVGAIHADWLDEREDLIRSDRRDILWDSEYGQALQAWGRDMISKLAAKGETSIRQHVWSEYLKRSGLEERLNAAFKTSTDLKDSVRSAARIFIGRTEVEALQDPQFIEGVTSLAFAVGPHRTLLQKLHEVSTEALTPFTVMVELFKNAGVAETYSLAQIARERVDSVKRLEQLIHATDTAELDLQRLIEHAPWLIQPDWTPLSANESLETFRRAFENWYQRSKKQEVTTSSFVIGDPTKRPDFILLNLRGVLHLIEIKKPNYAMTDEEYERVSDYLQAIDDFLSAHQMYLKEFPETKVTIVCDKMNLRKPINRQHFKGAKADGLLDQRTWLEFLLSTQRAHEDFLQATKQVSSDV